MKLLLLPSAQEDLDELRRDGSKARVLKDIVKTLNLMQKILTNIEVFQGLMVKRFLEPMRNKIHQEPIGFFGFMDRREI